MKIILFVLTSIYSMSCYSVQEKYPTTQEALQLEISNLNWEVEPQSYQLEKSKSSLQITEVVSLVRGNDAERYMYLTQGVEQPSVEAVIVESDTYSSLIFSYSESGYVSIDDWDDLDPNMLISEIQKNTEKDNIERVKNGLEPLSIDGWYKEPTLDKERNMVFWAIKGKEGDQDLVNAITLKLGKSGFEKIIWVGSDQQKDKTNAFQKTILDGHKFTPGFKYADYTVGDKIAAFGIASLVAASAGGKSSTAKTTLAAIGVAILVFLKKFIIIPIMLVFGGIWAFVKKPFSKKKSGDEAA